MDKNAVKKYAVWARNELIARVTQKAEQYEITKDKITPADADSIGGRVLSDTEKKQRQALISKINKDGFEQVMEEVAYTWFNRFTALRFMEVNNYLPSHTRVFTNDSGEFKPQILADAIQLNLDGLNMDIVYDLKDNNKTEELYKYLLITQCNALSKVLPGMFQRIADYTELLLPDYLLREGSVIEQMISIIPEDDWTDQVQIIGWLYQYYISEPKDEKINARKQYKTDDIPYVTQLFTSDWIVRFIVENSLGRYWIENNKNSVIKDKWTYYVETDQGEDSKSDYVDPKEITCIDPCAGSGHIIAYLFDVLIDIYEASGYSAQEAADSIVQNNVFGLDIDERASQLAYFSVMMKARQYDRRFLTRNIQPNVFAIQESENIDKSLVDYVVGSNNTLRNEFNSLLDQMSNAKIYGSIITIKDVDFAAIEQRMEEVISEGSLFSDAVKNELKPFVSAAKLLSRRYTIVNTNPPYMATKYMPNALKEYISTIYGDYKADMFSAFIVRCSEMCKNDGHTGFLSPYVWMFIQSYEKLREYVFRNMTFSSLVQLEYNAFESACVPVSAFTFRNYKSPKQFGCIKLSDFRGVDNQAPKTLEAINNRNCGYYYLANQDNFLKIPGAPIAYWVSENLINAFDNGVSVDSISDFTGSQHITADNNKYLRLFWEIDSKRIGKGKKWAYYAKGGEYRKWYGNIQLVVDISSTAMEYYRNCTTANCLKEKYWFQEGITYSAITSSGTGFRYYPPVGGFDKGGATICYVRDLYYVLGVLNTNMAETVFQVMNPTINLQVKDIKALPIIFDESKKQEIELLVKDNVSISKEDWDSFEVSYDFQINPLVSYGFDKIEDAYKKWEEECLDRFSRMKANEEKLNTLFNEIYGLTGDIPSEVREENVSIRKADKDRDIRLLISYAVGCMFGRYSLDKAGIVCSNPDLNENDYMRFKADKDNIIPVCDDEYFDDDIAVRFVDFIKVVFGEKYLEENLRYIADALGGKGTPREVIRTYFLESFFNDHCSNYAVTGLGKRPIYWMFESGKKNGFKCLIYMHRYQADSIARIRTDYVHEQQSRYRTAISDLEQRISSASTSERVKLNKQLTKIQDQATEIRQFEEKIHHLADQMIEMDLDEGLKSNYELFQGVLAKIK